MDELSREYRVLYVEQKEIVKERLIAVVVDSLDSLSDVVCGQLQCIAESYRHLNALTATQPNQELLHAQNVVQEAGRVYGQQLASTLTQGLDSLNILQTAATGSVAFNQPSADISISATQTNASTNQSNDANNDSDDKDSSVKSEINSEDECLSDSDSQPDVEVKEEPDETQTETEINDTATVKDENVSSSESESDSDSDDYESDTNCITMQVKEEEQEENEVRSIDTSNNQDSVADYQSIEESENIANSDGNVETVDSSESNSEHQSGGMMMDDEENATEDCQNEPIITVVNYGEFEAQFNGNSNIQYSVPDGSPDEESENASQQQGNTIDFHKIYSNEFDNEHSPGQELLDEQENSTHAISEQGQAGPPIVSNTTSTLTRPMARASSAKKGNYSETIENSLTGQKSTLIETRKRKRSVGRSGKSNASKRSRIGPALAVTASEVDDHSEEEEEDDPESEAISFRVIARHLNCHVPGCKKVFSGKAQLDAHLLAKHTIEKYACKVRDCTESYATMGELTTHRNSAHDNLDNDWPCGQCEVTCNNYQYLCVHTSEYHEYGLFACSADKCNFTEKTRIKVKNHQRKHRPAKYRCTYAGCPLSFNMKSHLTSHLRVHSQEKPFLCSQCPKAFSQKNNLTRHERVHSGLKPYSCTWPHCDFSASELSSVIKHIRGVHFGLPKSKKKQKEKGIIDNRDARLFVKKTVITTGN